MFVLQNTVIADDDAFYAPRNEVRGGGGMYWIHPVCLSVCPSVR